MELKTPLIKPVGYGVNIKYTTFWDRDATFTDERDAFAFYYLLSKSTEVCERNANIEIEKIYLKNLEYINNVIKNKEMFYLMKLQNGLWSIQDEEQVKQIWQQDGL